MRVRVSSLSKSTTGGAAGVRRTGSPKMRMAGRSWIAPLWGRFSTCKAGLWGGQFSPSVFSDGDGTGLRRFAHGFPDWQGGASAICIWVYAHSDPARAAGAEHALGRTHQGRGGARRSGTSTERAIAFPPAGASARGRRPWNGRGISHIRQWSRPARPRPPPTGRLQLGRPAPAADSAAQARSASSGALPHRGPTARAPGPAPGPRAITTTVADGAPPTDQGPRVEPARRSLAAGRSRRRAGPAIEQSAAE